MDDKITSVKELLERLKHDGRHTRRGGQVVAVESEESVRLLREGHRRDKVAARLKAVPREILGRIKLSETDARLRDAILEHEKELEAREQRRCEMKKLEPEKSRTCCPLRRKTQQSGRSGS